MDTNPPSEPQYPQYPEPTPPPYQPPPTQPPYPYPQPQYPQTPYPTPQYPQPQQPYPYPQQPYPYSQPLAQPPAQPPRRSRRTLWIVLGSIGGVLLLCCVIGTIAVVANGGSSFSNLNATATPNLPTATPKPTANPNASAAAYSAAIVPEANIITADFNQIGTDCGAQNLSACSSDSQKLHDDAAIFIQVLNQHPAPPCLKAADTSLRQGLKDYEDGSTLVVQGINNNDASMITAGSQKLDQGNTAVDQASAAITQAKC